MAERFEVWVRAYEAAWRTAGTARLGDLSSGEATYERAPVPS